MLNGVGYRMRTHGKVTRKGESADEARWWAAAFAAVEGARGWQRAWIGCIFFFFKQKTAYEMEEFLFHLRDRIVGLNLGRWDYMASLIHWNLMDPAWVLPDRNTIPHNVAFFQNLRELLVEVCHKRGILAIGGMTALYPSRADLELNQRALRVLEEAKQNEAGCLMDGAWTGHPHQNEIAVKKFRYPYKSGPPSPHAARYADL